MRGAWALALGLLLTAFLASPVLGARDFTADATPQTLVAGQSTTVTITITNTTESDRHDVINCMQFRVAQAFDISSASIQSVYGQVGLAFAQWATIWDGSQLVTFKDPLELSPLVGSDGSRDEAVFRIRGVATGPAQTMNWQATAYTNAHDLLSNDCSGRIGQRESLVRCR